MMRGVGQFPQTVLVPSGRLARRGNEGRMRTVEVASLHVGRTPVTNREYAVFLEAARAAAPPWWNDPNFRAPLQPVVGVTWGEAAAFCAWLGETGGGHWRLPTEIEWEFAACGGLSEPRTAWGDEIPSGEVPEGPLEGPWEAGRGRPNGYGLLDM